MGEWTELIGIATVVIPALVWLIGLEWRIAANKERLVSLDHVVNIQVANVDRRLGKLEEKLDDLIDFHLRHSGS